MEAQVNSDARNFLQIEQSELPKKMKNKKHETTIEHLTEGND